jgi:hypothetical protein
VLRYKSLYIILFLTLFTSVFVQSQSDFKNPQEYAKQADKLFEAGEFQKAYPFYQTLRSNDAKNPDYNFRLGVCMMFSEPEDKARPIYYFDNALKSNIEDNRIYYYLGRAYHNNYRFAEAKNTYTIYKEKAKEKKVRSFDIDRRIQECENGIALLSHIKLLYVVDKQLVKDATFYKSYDINSSQAKIIAVPNSLKTKYDNKHRPPAFGVFVPDGNMLYYASYGAKGEQGLDIYRVKQDANGGWEKPENLGDQVNTPYDDAYPFITPDGRSLYFSSKGHNSMGGYDVFKSEFSLSSFSWSKVENLNFPINTPFDDIFFVPDTSKNLAYFSSDRQSLAGKIYVYHIGLDKQSEEQDLAKAFRDGADDKDLVRLLKDIADLKTNINVDDYKSKINKQNDSNVVEEAVSNNKEIIANNNPIKKIDLDDSKELDHIVGESYNSYKKIAYKAVKLKNQKNNIGKIAADNDKIAKELKAKGDDKSIAEAKKYEKAARVSRRIADSLKVQIKVAENSANEILVQSGYLQRYAGLKQKDSVEITYAKIIKIKSKVDNQRDVAQEIVAQEQAVIQAKRDAASAKYKENQDALNAINDEKSELKEYEDALSSITDESERQEYIEIINAMKSEVAKKIAKQKAIEAEYLKLRDAADATALALSKVDDVINEYIAANQKESAENDEQVAAIDENVVVAKTDAKKYIDENAEIIAANENINTTGNEAATEKSQENVNSQSSEAIAANENVNTTGNEAATEKSQENVNSQSSEAIAANENINTTGNEAATEKSQENVNSQSSEVIAANENVKTTENETSTEQAQEKTTNQTSEVVAANENVKTTENETSTEQAQEKTTSQTSEVVAANENVNTTGNEAATEQSQEKTTSQTSEVVAANENVNTTGNEAATEKSQENANSQTSKTTAANENVNASENETISEQNKENTPNIEYTTIGSKENSQNNVNAANTSAVVTGVSTAAKVVGNTINNNTNETNTELASNKNTATENANQNNSVASNNEETTNQANNAVNNNSGNISTETNTELASNKNTATENTNQNNNVASNSVETTNQANNSVNNNSENISTETNTELASNENAATENTNQNNSVASNSVETTNQANNAANKSIENISTETNTELASNENAANENTNQNNNIVSNNEETTNQANNAANNSTGNISTETNTELASNENAATKNTNQNNNVASNNEEDTNQNNNTVNNNSENIATETNTELASNEDSQIAIKRQEIEKVYTLNKSLILNKKSSVETAIDSNKIQINRLENIANNEYQLFNIQNDSANQLINNFNKSEIKTQSQIDEIYRLKNEAQQHKINALSAYKVSQQIANENTNNEELLSEIASLETANSIGEITNIDSLENSINQINSKISYINPKSVNNDSINEVVSLAYANLNDLKNQKQVQQNELASLESEKLQLEKNAASDVELDDLSEKISNSNKKIEKLDEEIALATSEYNKANSVKYVLSNYDSENIVSSNNNDNISTEIASLSENPNEYINTTSSQIANLEKQIESNNNVTETSTENIIAENIPSTDSVYIPTFKQEQLNVLASKYLEPSITAIENIRNVENQNYTKQQQTAYVENEYSNIANALLNDISSLKTELVASEDTAKSAAILRNIKNKQEQYIAVKRKQIAANLYSNLLIQEKNKLENTVNRIEEEFIANRNSISNVDTNNITIAALNEASGINDENIIENYLKNLDSSSKTQKQKIAVLNVEKDDVEKQYSVQLQKLDQISYEIEQTTKPNKLEKLNTQLKEIEPVANSLSVKLEDINNQIQTLSDSVVQRENVIAALNQHSEYLSNNEIDIADNTITTSVPKDVDLSMFNSESKLTKENLGMAYVEISTKPSLKYYVTNSVDLVYFDENNIPLVKYMLTKKHAELIQQQIDLLKDIDLNSISTAKQAEVNDRIVKLEELQRLVNSKVIELQELAYSEVTANNSDTEIDNQEFIQNIHKEASEYQQLSKRLSDTAQYFNGYEKQKIIALANKMNTRADSVNSIFIELNDIQNKLAYQRNELTIAQLELKAPEGQITNQAKMQLDEAVQNLNFAKNNRASLQNPDLSSDDRQQLINQAVQYEQMALKNQQNAIELLQTQSESIASNETSEVNNELATVSETNKSEDSVNNPESNNQANITNEVIAANSSESNTNQVNSKEIELEELALIDPTKLSGEERVNYEVRKADILGAFIGDVNSNINVDFYSNSNPIEIDPEMPNGLSYRVQIAAFRKPIPQNTFADVKPIIAETSPTSAFTRYMAGLFLNYNDANTAKNSLRNKGYVGAFVVPYYNGKRISNAQANNIISRGEAYTDSKLVAAAEKLNVKNFGSNNNLEQIALSVNPDDTGKELRSELQSENSDLVFSVQVGVFGGLRSSARLANATDLFYDITSNGYYRYFSGKYNQEQAAIAAKNIIRENGITDAFVVAFYKGQKVSLRNARQLLQTNSSVNNNATITNTEATTNNQNAEIQQVQNAIVYKVQIGAFRSERAGNQLSILENISLNGLDTYTNNSGLVVYTSKAYLSYQEAIAARDQIRNNGNSDVFVIAFENNIRISTRIARQKLGR